MKSVEIMVGKQTHTLTTKDTLATVRSVLSEEQIDIAIKKAELDRKEKAIANPLFIISYILRENLPFSEESKMVRMIIEGLLYKTESTYQEVLQGKL